MGRAIPRAAIRYLVKKHQSQLRLDANVDLLIYLNFVLFLKRLAAEARLKAIEDRCSVIKPAHIRAVAKAVLKQSRG